MYGATVYMILKTKISLLVGVNTLKIRRSKMSKILTRIRALQEKHKILDREVTDLEDERNGDRTSSSKFELVKKKKEKLALRDEINRLKAEQENGSK